MPLLTSPIDGSPMKPVHRFGIEIDVCPTSGGIWLDKGELEKLLSFIKQAVEDESEAHPPRPSSADYDKRGHGHYADHDRHDRYDDDYPSYGSKRPFKKKKSGLSQIMDIFDF